MKHFRGILGRTSAILIGVATIAGVLFFAPYFTGREFYHLMQNQINNPFEFIGAWMLGWIVFCVAIVIIGGLYLIFKNIFEFISATISWIIRGSE